MFVKKVQIKTDKLSNTQQYTSTVNSCFNTGIHVVFQTIKHGVFTISAGISGRYEILYLFINWTSVYFETLKYYYQIKNKKLLQVMWMFYLGGDLDRRLVRYTDKLLTLDKVIPYWQFSATVLCITTLYTRIIWRTFYLIFWGVNADVFISFDFLQSITPNTAFSTCKMFVVYYT